LVSTAESRTIPVHSSRRLLSDAAKIFLGASLALPTGIVTAGLLSRALGADLYGSFSVASSIIIFIELISSQFFTRTTVKFVAEAADWAHVAGVQAWGQLRVSLIIMLGLMLIAPLLENMLHSPGLTLYLRLFALDIPVAALASHQGATLVGRGNAGNRGAMIGARWIIRMMLIIVLVGVFELSIEGAILSVIAASACELVIGRLFMRAPLLRMGKSPAHHTAYMLPVLLNTAQMELLRRMDLLAVESFNRSDATAGYYAAAQNLTFALVLVSVALTPTVLASVTRLIHARKRVLARRQIRVVNQVLFCLLPVSAFIAGCSAFIVRVIYGDSFAPTAVLLPPLIIGTIGMVMMFVQASIFIANGKPQWAFGIGLPMTPLMLFALIALVPTGGALMAALIFAAMAWIGGVVYMTANLRLWSLPFPLLTILLCALASIAAYGIGAALPL
jgi:O-antigen/teichoic acid export membrane protein